MMPKLILQFEGLVLKEFAVGPIVTIGRLPDNTIVIENPAVSGHHARVVCEGDAVILEDLESTNGTFINDQHVTRRSLQQGDAVLVGKHKLVFDRTDSTEAATPSPSALKNLGDTVYLDTRKHRALLATLRDARAAAENPTRPTGVVGAPAVTGTTGVLRVLAGRADRSEYFLDAHTSLIGASDDALVRLHGWFKPKVAVAIARNRAGYIVTLLGGTTRINNVRLGERHHLKEGDILQVSGLTLEFGMQERAAEPLRTAG
jgi:pSer/pThr/pTyr-binding forkhead associated (FHA) protein